MVGAELGSSARGRQLLAQRMYVAAVVCTKIVMRQRALQSYCQMTIPDIAVIFHQQQR